MRFREFPAGASGNIETDIFKNHCPVPLDEVRELSHEVLMRMLPGIASRNLDLFGSSVNAVQRLGFKKVELSLQPKQIPELIERLRSAGAACAGMRFIWSCRVRHQAIQTCGAIEQAARAFMDEHSRAGSTLITSAR